MDVRPLHAPALPSSCFRYPHQLVQDPHMTLDEKRAIPAAWASDQHAVESFLTSASARHAFSGDVLFHHGCARRTGSQVRCNDDYPPPKNAGAIRRLGLRAAA